jgi:UDP:flavonoid glycosyltransferase YjiC (YdhE family)
MVASLWKEDYDCLRWLDEQEDQSVLFVSFGSITVVSSKQFMELALGLEMSFAPILWVIRSDLMIENKPIAFPDGYLERMHDRSCFVSWAPQKQVLIHRAVGGFLTHCGWNSTLESICAGVPILGWPYFADQRLNCRQCVDHWKVGFEIQVDESNLATREEVCRKVKMLMKPSNLSVRENAQIWKGRAHRAIEGEEGSSNVRWREFHQAFAELFT